MTLLETVLAHLVAQDMITAAEADALYACASVGYEDCPEPESEVLKRLMAEVPVRTGEYFATATPRGEQYGMLLSKNGATVHLRRVNADGTPYGGDNDEAYQTFTAHEATLRPLVFDLNVLKYRD